MTLARFAIQASGSGVEAFASPQRSALHKKGLNYSAFSLKYAWTFLSHRGYARKHLAQGPHSSPVLCHTTPYLSWRTVNCPSQVLFSARTFDAGGCFVKLAVESFLRTILSRFHGIVGIRQGAISVDHTLRFMVLNTDIFVWNLASTIATTLQWVDPWT